MLHIVQFSGGAASAYVAKLVAEENHGKTILLFHDTKAEHPDAYRFRRQVAKYIGLPITEASDGRDLWQVIEDNNCLPSDRIPFCSEILKINPAKKFYKTLNEPYTLYNGFGVFEWNRVLKARLWAQIDGYQTRSPLCDRMITDGEVKRVIRDEWKICLPQPYQYLQHNNCIPCFKGGKGHFLKVWKHYPEEFLKAIEMEKEIGYTVFKDKCLAELAERWAKGLDQEELEMECAVPCMCAL